MEKILSLSLRLLLKQQLILEKIKIWICLMSSLENIVRHMYVLCSNVCLGAEVHQTKKRFSQTIGPLSPVKTDVLTVLNFLMEDIVDVKGNSKTFTLGGPAVGPIVIEATNKGQVLRFVKSDEILGSVG